MLRHHLIIKGCHLIPLLSFFSAISFCCCHNSHAGLPSSKSAEFSFKILLKFSFCSLLSSTPCISTSFWTILWSFEACLIASFSWFCAFLTLSISSSLDKYLRFAVGVSEVLSLFLSGSKSSCLNLDQHDLKNLWFWKHDLHMLFSLFFKYSQLMLRNILKLPLISWLWNWSSTKAFGALSLERNGSLKLNRACITSLYLLIPTQF